MKLLLGVGAVRLLLSHMQLFLETLHDAGKAMCLLLDTIEKFFLQTQTVGKSARDK